MESDMKKMEEDQKKAAPEEPAAEGATAASQPTKEIVEHLETQNRKLHASFDALKKEIA